MSVVIALLAIPVIFIGWFALMYNSLIQGRNRCDESWADIDTELKRRYDLIPNLVNTVQGYVKHEREVLERVTSIRGSALTDRTIPAPPP